MIPFSRLIGPSWLRYIFRQVNFTFGGFMNKAILLKALAPVMVLIPLAAFAIPRPSGLLETDCTIDSQFGDAQVDYVGGYGSFAPMQLTVDTFDLYANLACDAEVGKCVGFSESTGDVVVAKIERQDTKNYVFHFEGRSLTVRCQMAALP